MRTKMYFACLVICLVLVGIGGMLSAPAGDIQSPRATTPAALPVQPTIGQADAGGVILPLSGFVAINWRPSAAGGGCTDEQCNRLPAVKKSDAAEPVASDSCSTCDEGNRLRTPLRRVATSPLKAARVSLKAVGKAAKAMRAPLRLLGRLRCRR